MNKAVWVFRIFFPKHVTRGQNDEDRRTKMVADSFRFSTIGRRGALLSAAALLQHPDRLNAYWDEDKFKEPGFEDAAAGFLDNYLRMSSIYSVSPDSTQRALPSARRTSSSTLIRTLQSKRAVFLGEHHPDLRDHLLQASLLRSMIVSDSKRPLAVGVEAVQRQFQPVLDAYIARRITEDQLFAATDWARRWYWSFDGYAPIFRICREYGLPLIALDADSEDKAQVELGGLAALSDATLRRYIPDLAGYERFGSTRAFGEYVSYTLRPPYELQRRLGQKMTASTQKERTMSFENFLARQCFRDEAMASASAAWLDRHPDGLLLGLCGTNHAKFTCGVQARTARMLGGADASSTGGLDAVGSILLNPTPFNSFNGPLNLRACDKTSVPNEACVRNDIELQNYVLQLPFASDMRSELTGDRRRAEDDQREAVAAMQAKRGMSVLALSDFMMFSPLYEARRV